MSETAKRKQEDTSEGLDTKRPAVKDDNAEPAGTDSMNGTAATTATPDATEPVAPAEQDSTATTAADEQSADPTATTSAATTTATTAAAEDKPAPQEASAEATTASTDTAAAPATATPAEGAPAAPADGTAATEQANSNPADAPLAEGHVLETVNVADHQVGRLIGREGSNIRQMEALSGCQVNVPAECEPGTSVRKITLRGSPESVRYCKQMLEQKIREDGGDPSAPATETITKIAYIPDDHVGRVIGRQGSTIRQIQELSGAHMDIAKECRPGEYQREVTVTGTPAQVEKCEELIRKKVSGESLPPAPTRSANDTIITIPDEMVGRIIGKGGCTIRELQDNSGAHMDVAKAPNPGTNKREIVVRGQPQQIAYCTYLINTKIAELTGDYTRNFVEGPPEVLTAAANMGSMYAQLRQQQMMQQAQQGYGQQGYGQYPQQQAYDYSAYYQQQQQPPQ
ncbi:hypothetical protein, variant [Salpingoeca rosetta]|uniref:K Homology domain-containing protein n=1 Tax=Salpingoeca rosetta (strain ATCC 50818 / BSB-021) TaxID=946362 RepID=F2UGU9_SALR5|nr:hypothetical protein, variant [Salpingoeca rosetta]EGD75849.1 hypothetical protein, variant [Salpingoeca rosetta]|eukprot:XP_004991770.1 hypothetical protein, variant [Salpingoeca rosetta]